MNNIKTASPYGTDGVGIHWAVQGEVAVIPSGDVDSFHKLRLVFVPSALITAANISILFTFFKLDFGCWQFQLVPAGIGFHLDQELCRARQCGAFSRFKLTALAI